MNVELDVRTYLVGSGATMSGCSTSFTFVGPVRKKGAGVGVEAVFIRQFGGLMPNGFMDDRGQTRRSTDVQVRIRGKVNDYINTRIRAENIWVALNRTERLLDAVSSTVDYFRVEPLQSSPTYIGQDDQEHDEFVVNARVHSLNYADPLGTIYYGAAPTLVDEAAVLALTSQVTARHSDFSATAASGEYIWYVYPISLGTPQFTFNNFTGGFQSVATLSVSGVNCAVQRSNQPGLGLTNLAVSLAD